MKTSILYLAFSFVVGLSGAAQAFSTTFAEYDEMTLDEQSEFIADRGVTIYTWLKKNEPAIAKCMYEKLKIGQNLKTPPPAFIELEKQIRGVSEEDRPKYHVEALMANYIVEDICAGLEKKPASEQSRPAAK